MEEKTPIISFRNADIINGEATVIYDLNMDVFPGDFVYIVGKVGTGKTSIIRTIIAENPLHKGKGTACGFELKDIKDKEIPYLRRKMGVVFQDFQLLMDRSVEDNLLFVLQATGWKDEEQMKKRITSVLEAVGMELKRHKMPHQLSGGEQQRIAINETADGIMKLLTGINRDKGTAIVMVTHNRQIFEKYPGRVMVCREETCYEQDPDEAIDLELTI